MNYDFDKVWDRVGHDATKWDAARDPKSPIYSTAETIVPMWVADMDFATAPSVVDALKERIEHPLFGYFPLPDRYIDAIANWQKTRFGISYPIERSNIMYQNSVLGGVASFLSAYTRPGENVLINSSTYVGFQGTAKNLARPLCYSDLVKDENGTYRMDFEDMERKIVENKTSVMIFCSPHNPTGRVWEKWEIEKVVELCDKYEMKIISDEIWADFIVDPNCKHIPTQSVSERAKQITMALYAPSKTFNLAGLVGSYSLMYNAQMINKITATAASTHYNGANVLSCHALIGGYEGGAEWVNQLVRYIRGNQEYIVNYMNEHFQGVKAYLPQGTYLLWVDITDCGKEFAAVYQEMKDVGVLVNDGHAFQGGSFLRFNTACPRSACEEAMKRLHKVFLPRA